MRQALLILIIILLLDKSYCNTFYISPAGIDTNTGQFESPFYSVQKAVNLSQSGDTIYLRGGIYKYIEMITIGPAKSGNENLLVNLWAFPGEYPVLNYSGQEYASANRAILLTGDYWYIKGIEICYAGDNGIKIEGSHNIIEKCVFHHNGDSGLQIGFAHETENPGGLLGAYNKVINCDSYMNFDFDSKGGDADGFACKMHNGKGNIFNGCRAWYNSDDGWDLFETDWPVEIFECWTWHNGDKSLFEQIYLDKMGTKMSSFSGNGNGFKLGGNGTGGSSNGMHIAKKCVAFDNYFQSKKGFDQNSHKGGVIVHNCLSFGNGYNYMFEDDPESGAKNEFINNISFENQGAMEYEFSSGAIQKNNSWNLILVAGRDDFQNLDETLAKASREADGSLPVNAFARLVANSDLINKGTDVGLPYVDTAPDLGAFEYFDMVAEYVNLAIAIYGEGKVFPAGGSYIKGTSITLQAVPDEEWNFINWSDDVEGTNNPLSIILDSNINITVRFASLVNTEDITDCLMKEEHFIVFPNPCKSIATINFHLNKTEKVKISLIKMDGQEMVIISDKIYIAGNHLVDISEMVSREPGIYFICLEKENRKYFRKIIKQ